MLDDFNEKYRKEVLKTKDLEPLLCSSECSEKSLNSQKGLPSQCQKSRRVNR